MEINFIMTNFSNFYRIEPHLELLKSYWDSFNHGLSRKDTLNNLASLFLKEPTAESLFPLAKKINEKKEKMLYEIEQIKNKVKFREIVNEPDKFAIISRCERDLMLNILNRVCL